MPRDLVNALTELRIRIWREAGADALIERPKCLAAVLAQVVAPVEMPRCMRLPSRIIVCMQSPPLPGCHLRT